MPDHANPPTDPRSIIDAAADGQALGTGPARESLWRSLQALSQAELETGPGRPAALCQALTETASALAGLQAYSPAESHLAQALRWAMVMGAVDTRADLCCKLAELASQVADLAESNGEQPNTVRRARDRARDQAFEAVRLADQRADPHWEIGLLLRACDVLARCGDHDDAAKLKLRANKLTPSAPSPNNATLSKSHDSLRIAGPATLM
jgi:hypothetical protein